MIARRLSIKITRRWWSIFDDNVLCFSLRVCVLSRIARRARGEGDTHMYSRGAFVCLGQFNPSSVRSSLSPACKCVTQCYINSFHNGIDGCAFICINTPRLVPTCDNCIRSTYAHLHFKNRGNNFEKKFFEEIIFFLL